MMLHASTTLWYHCDGNIPETGNRCLLDRRATAWNQSVLSIIVFGLSSLMNSMSVAFSPFTASTFVDHDRFYFDSMYFLATPVLFADCGTESSTSGDTSENSVEDCIQDEIANTKTSCKERNKISSAITTAKRIAASALAQIPVLVVAFEATLDTRELQKPPERNRDVHAVANTSILDETNNDGDGDDGIGFVLPHAGPYSDQDQRPKKRARLVSISSDKGMDQSFSKKRSSSSTPSIGDECDEYSETTEKTTVRTLGERKKKKQRRKQEDWEVMFQLLSTYKNEHGDTDVPISYVRNNKKLGKWVSIQQTSYKSKNLSNCRQEMLDSIGFSCNSIKPTKEWMKSYKSLVAYKDEHGGSTAVPRRYPQNKKLGFWIRRQRKNFRRNQLSTVQIDLLESIGFSWDGRVGENEMMTGN